MIEPTGPCSRGVYWRRRLVAAGACVLAVIVLAWIIGGLVGTADDRPVRGTAGVGDLAAPRAPPPHSKPPDTPPATTTVTTSSGTPPPTSATASPHAARTTSARPSGPPKPCPDRVVKVGAESDARSYRVGDQPLLRLVVVNAGAVPCVRDVSRKLRELVITTANGRKRLWSSNDCYGPPDTDRRTLAAGKRIEFTLHWAGRTSAPGCPVDRGTVPAGTYRLTGRLGRLTSPPARLVLTR